MDQYMLDREPGRTGEKVSIIPVNVVVARVEFRSDPAQALEAAASFRLRDDEEVESILARTAVNAENGALEPYKATRNHDLTSVHPGSLELAKLTQ